MLRCFSAVSRNGFGIKFRLETLQLLLIIIIIIYFIFNALYILNQTSKCTKQKQTSNKPLEINSKTQNRSIVLIILTVLHYIYIILHCLKPCRFIVSLISTSIFYFIACCYYLHCVHMFNFYFYLKVFLILILNRDSQRIRSDKVSERMLWQKERFLIQLALKTW